MPSIYSWVYKLFLSVIKAHSAPANIIWMYLYVIVFVSFFIRTHSNGKLVNFIACCQKLFILTSRAFMLIE